MKPPKNYPQIYADAAKKVHHSTGASGGHLAACEAIRRACNQKGQYSGPALSLFSAYFRPKGKGADSYWFGTPAYYFSDSADRQIMLRRRDGRVTALLLMSEIAKELEEKGEL